MGADAGPSPPGQLFPDFGPTKLSPPRLVDRAQQSGVEWIPKRGLSAWARKPGKPAWASRNNSPIQIFICLGWFSERSRAEPQESSSPGSPGQYFCWLGAHETEPPDPAPPCQNVKPRFVHRAQQGGVEVAPCDHWGSVVELAAATRTFVGAPKRPWPRGGLRWCSLWARETCETLRDAAWQMQKIHNKWWSLRNPRAQALLANSYMGLGRAGPLRLGHNLSKTSLDLQKQFPNTKFHLKFVQFWAVVHLPHSGQRNWASSSEC